MLSCLELGDEILSETQFVAIKKYVRERVIDQAVRVSVSLESAMARLRSLRQRLGGKVPVPWLSTISAMKSHIQALCDAPLYSTPPDRLIDLDRYLQAVEQRLEKLQSRLLLDAQWQKEIEDLESSLKNLWPTYPDDWRYQDHQLVDLRWQIEEFRVLCFAQALKTRDKVSYKRLSTALREYRKS